MKCCLCRYDWKQNLESTDLPGTGYRCMDRYECAQRVRSVIDAHKTFAQACDEVT